MAQQCRSTASPSPSGAAAGYRHRTYGPAPRATGPFPTRAIEGPGLAAGQKRVQRCVCPHLAARLSPRRNVCFSGHRAPPSTPLRALDRRSIRDYGVPSRGATRNCSRAPCSQITLYALFRSRADADDRRSDAPWPLACANQPSTDFPSPGPSSTPDTMPASSASFFRAFH